MDGHGPQDAHPENIGVVDFVRPDGTPSMLSIGDYRQLNDATFHAGLESRSLYEFVERARARRRRGSTPRT